MKTVTFLLVVLFVLAGILTSCDKLFNSPPVDNGDSPPAIDYEKMEQELAELIRNHPDQMRPEMHWHPILHQIAREHTCDMAEREYFSHVSPEGYGPNYRARQAGYPLPDNYSPDGNGIESLASTSSQSAERVLELWLNSPGHKTHILGEAPLFVEQLNFAVGLCIGTIEREGHTFPRYYWAFIAAP